MRQFAAHGFAIVGPEDEAEVYVVNSCTVTGEGERKSLQMLRRFRRRNPQAVIALCGCFPQAFPEAAAAVPEADVVTGAKNRAQLLPLVMDRLSGRERAVAVAPHAPGEPFEPMRVESFAGRTRAFLKIEDGCERSCAYCIIPAARGPVRSRPLSDIRAELAALAEGGYREAVLVGINLSSYGQDIGLRLLDAVRLACSVPGIDRVRLGSLEPELLTPADVAGLRELGPLCPQFHLSLQSGCDGTLRRMNRRYDTGGYRRIAQGLREAFPGCALTTDVMVGFPGESEAEFLESLAFVREMGFARTHVFAYSERPGTRAAAMEGQVPQAVKNERAKRMAEAAAACRADFLQAQVGETAEVLFETQVSPGVWEGHGRNYTPVRMRAEQELSGRLVQVFLTGVFPDGCLGVPSVQDTAPVRGRQPRRCGGSGENVSI